MAVRALQMLTSSTTCWCIAVCAAGKSSNPEVLATGSTHGMFTNSTLLLSRASEDGAPILDDRASRAHASLPLGCRPPVTG